MDMVNKPPHYNQGGIECIEGIEASMSKEAFAGYCKGNVMKYLWRYEYKGKLEDLKKSSVVLRQTCKVTGGIDERGRIVYSTF